MGVKLQAAALCLFLVLVVSSASAQTFDVTKFGAKPNGPDISQALLTAFKQACASTTASKIVVPKGSFTLGETKMQGPCKSPLQFELQGVLQASKDPKSFEGKDSWVTFNYIDRFTLYGGGVFDGQGHSAWAINDCNKNSKCSQLPANLRFNFITNSTIRDITSKDSKNFHVNVIGCKNFTFTKFNIFAPGDSINTDGIHLGRSNGVNITESTISTGDDCISIGDGMVNLYVTKVTCGPGHGLSIGSLGKYVAEEPVVGIHIVNCTIQNTQNGVRIKTWPSVPGKTTVSDVHFEDIILKDVNNPILIDQEYCPSGLCKLDSPSLVKISQVSFKNIRGTSTNKDAVKLLCSKGVPCENVEVGDIEITYKGAGGPATFSCSNVKPKLTGKQIPAACSSPVPSPPKS